MLFYLRSMLFVLQLGYMKSREEVLARLSEFRDRLLRVECAIAEETRLLPFHARKRRIAIAKFLHVERRINAIVVRELEWVINENDLFV